MRLKRAIVAIALGVGFATAVFAQPASQLIVTSARHHADGIDQVFEFEIENASDVDVVTRGRLVVINIYDASLPRSIAIQDVRVPARGKSTIPVRWGDAPLIGQVRALLVLNDGLHPSLVENFDFLIVPLFGAAVFLGLVFLAVAIALVALRLPKYLKRHVPTGMLPYVVEFEDTVVTLSNRFDVTWQDIVRANKLKPPYELKVGSRIFIPKHALRRPESASKP